jgi:D-alanyl-D-alanine carboxypeptidase
VVPPDQQTKWLQMVSTTTGEPIDDLSADDPQGFALGLVQALMEPDRKVWFYQGTTLGYRTLYVWYEAEDLMITVQTNSPPDDDEGRLRDAVTAIHDALAEP